MRIGWSAEDFPVSGTPLRRTDVVLGILLFALGAIATHLGSGLLDLRLLAPGAMDVWFEADVPRVFEILTNRWALNDRSTVHPIFALLLIPPVFVLRTLFDLDPWVAVRAVYAGVAGLWIASLFALLRLIGCRRIDATAFTLLGATSAGAMFWFPIPETHTLASPTIVLAMIVVAVSAHRAVPALVEVAVSASTLGMTVTNWMAGILASVVRRPWRQALQISVNAFALVVVLWAVQKRLVPSSPFFIGNPPSSVDFLGPLHVAQAFFMHSVVMPAITVADRPGAGLWPVMLVQPASPGSAGAWSLISTVLWGGLLCAGLWALVSLRGRERLRIYLALLLAGQFALHLMFGNETFLYAPNFLPILIVVAALAALSRARRAVVIGAFALTATNTIGNVVQWKRANAFFVAFAPFQHDASAAIRARPEGPWPAVRGSKDLEIASPGARIFDIGFSSPGGGFRPGLHQFAIAFWVLDDRGALLATSDDLSLEEITSRIDRRADSSVTKVDVVTPYYRAAWTSAGTRRWRLELTVPARHRVALAVRAGPYRSPLRQLEWDGARLLVNDRYSIDTDSPAIAVFLVDENVPAWVSARPSTRRISVPNGWAAARLEVLEPGAYTFIVRDTSPFGTLDRELVTLPPVAGKRGLAARATGSGPSGSDRGDVGRGSTPRGATSPSSERGRS